jgi:hypothetical protein
VVLIGAAAVVVITGAAAVVGTARRLHLRMSVMVVVNFRVSVLV